MYRNLTSLFLVAVMAAATALVALAADEADRWNGYDLWNNINPVNSTGVGQRVWFNPTTAGMSGTLDVRSCRTNAVWAEPAVSGVTFNIRKCSQRGNKDDVLSTDCALVNSFEWDAAGGTWGYVGDFARLEILTPDPTARIVHQCGG